MRIEYNNLIKTFGDKTAVNIPEFSIEHGEILGLVGNNGAGKTTLFRLTLDLLKADSGTVSLSSKRFADDGMTAASLRPSQSEAWKAHTGAYLDEGFLLDFLTPDEYFTFVAKVNNISSDELAQRLAYFEPLSNGEVLGQTKYIRDLSAGNKQKTGIIGAMLNQPDMIILDEPFNYLDPSGQNQLKRILQEYNQQTGATIIISSHSLHNTTDISTSIALMEHGAIIRRISNANGEAEKELEAYFA